MAKATDTLGILKQNLLDAGCDEQTISKCITLAESGEWDKLFSILSQHKATLLNNVHKSHKQIDCLDFLTYRLTKEHQKEK